jgi:hypothetical protein
VDHAREVARVQLSGRPGSRNERRAAHEVTKLAEDVPPRQVVETVLAVIMMLELEPRRFRTDRAFKTQLVRLVRAQTDVKFGEKWDSATSKVKRWYKELPPKATAIMGQWLIDALGAAALRVARLERTEMEQAAGEKQALQKALSELQ